jgi:hypothetical protein
MYYRIKRTEIIKSVFEINYELYVLVVLITLLLILAWKLLTAIGTS